MGSFRFIFYTVLILSVSPWLCLLKADDCNFNRATIITATSLVSPEKKAVEMLMDEVGKRSHLVWLKSNIWPEHLDKAAAYIAIGQVSKIQDFAGQYASELTKECKDQGAEGFHIFIKRQGETPIAFIIGNDARGVLYGVGRFLRELRMTPGRVCIADNVKISSKPAQRLRGHQLGYRPKTNSYDAWDLPVWEQYLRDLAVFGCNAIELIPPRSDDDADSPHFPRPPMEMMQGMAKLAADFDMDVWVWYPAMDRDYSDARTVESALDEWSKVYQALPRLDAVFVPGGDPGHTQPKYLMALLEKQTERLHRYHPKAQMWVSPQGFTKAWMEEFLAILNQEQPSWLSGLVFGPQVRLGLPQLKAAIPPQYPIRHYPDITHTRQCQYPVPLWDTAYAITEGRECINPRPEDQAAIFRATASYCVGFLTYSEGCNDDVNKFIWSALGWNPDARVHDIMREYSRYFIGETLADDFAQGLLALERNWRAPLLANANVLTTLTQFQSMEKSASPGLLKNWRFQQALFRAYYDAYLRNRLIYETELENKAMARLRQASIEGSHSAMAAAENLLDSAAIHPVSVDWRGRISELAEALYQSIGMQLSVEKYRAIAVDRGAALDTVDFPLNNRLWLKEQFAKIRDIKIETDRLNEIRKILEWTNPGPGGYYDDLGNAAMQPHLVFTMKYASDPGFLVSSRVGFEEDSVVDEPDEKPGISRRYSWLDHAESLYEAPLLMHYPDLDPTAHYKLRVVYAGDSPKRKIRLLANDIEVHPFILKPFPYKPVEFAIPREATVKGELTLQWNLEPGVGGNGRGCQVSEVWLIKVSPASQK